MKRSKILSFLLLSVLCLGFVSCSSDDDDDNAQTSDSIIGTWVSKRSDIVAESKTNYPEFTEPLTTFFLDETFADYQEFTFREDSTYTVVTPSWDEGKPSTGTYSLKNDVLTVVPDEDDEDGEDDLEVVKIKVSGDKMTMNIDYTDIYPFGWCIETVIRENEKFSTLDTTDVKVEKMVVTRTWFRK